MNSNNYLGTMIYVMMQSALIAIKIWGEGNYGWFVAFLPTVIVLGFNLIVAVFAAIVAIFTVKELKKRGVFGK